MVKFSIYLNRRVFGMVSAIFTRKTHFVRNWLLFCTPSHFCREVYSNRKEFAPKESKFFSFKVAGWYIQLILVISTSLISNNRLSRSKALVPAYIFVKCGCANYVFRNSANLICRGTDISKYFSESLGIRDNEWLYTLNIRTLQLHTTFVLTHNENMPI